MITSPRNATVAAALDLRSRPGRERERRFLAEGPGAVAEALRAGVVDSLFVVPGGPQPSAGTGTVDLPLHEISPAVMRRLAATVSPQGPVAVCRFVDAPLEAIDPSRGAIVFLSEIRDPGNLGTIVRTADAAGAAGVVVSLRSVDVYNGKAVRASAGSLFHVPVTREVDPSAALSSLSRRGVHVLAAAADGGDDLYGERVGGLLEGPVVLLFGNEAHGLDPAVRRLAEATVRIPMRGNAESLNLAAAAAVILFEAARRRASG